RIEPLSPAVLLFKRCPRCVFAVALFVFRAFPFLRLLNLATVFGVRPVPFGVELVARIAFSFLVVLPLPVFLFLSAILFRVFFRVIWLLLPLPRGFPHALHSPLFLSDQPAALRASGFSLFGCFDCPLPLFRPVVERLFRRLNALQLAPVDAEAM